MCQPPCSVCTAGVPAPKQCVHRCSKPPSVCWSSPGVYDVPAPPPEVCRSVPPPGVSVQRCVCPPPEMCVVPGSSRSVQRCVPPRVCEGVPAPPGVCEGVPAPPGVCKGVPRPGACGHVEVCQPLYLRCAEVSQELYEASRQTEASMFKIFEIFNIEIIVFK